MARNAPTGDGQRKGMVKKRSQVRSGLTGKQTKRDTTSGQFMDQKADEGKFKGVRREKTDE
jgi:hypothetical protein